MSGWRVATRAGAHQLFSKSRSIDIGFGTSGMGRAFAMYYLWSSQRIQELQAQLRKWSTQGRVQ